ncbi:Transcriptional regulator [Hahella chejuensis KCTC 2396]|uniref:Transcriptional regulator n=1 Tax=Hahella chejuensis (strain KCTC 2396) TaxID=349521 RepID=Q2S744_HAHCH|nr:substrate-binding domain-containing protein [Hahella chejuensis]ABC33530.1 Transcriptional regulator [Hahella chejuensis KCTC 2396]
MEQTIRKNAVKKKRLGAQPAASTVTEVAKRAGVSVSTVSRILNGTARVSDDKRRSVERAIEDLNFKPNVLAQSLKSGQSMTIGVITQAVESPFFNELLKGIEEGLQGSGYASLMASGHWNSQSEIERIRLLIARRVDGIILLTGNLNNEQILDLATQTPIVAVGHNAHSENAASIFIDSRMGGYLATKHLISLGHRRIAHIQGPQEQNDASNRLHGYKMALEEAGIAFDEDLLAQGDFIEPGGLMAMNRLLDKGVSFSAVFCANDQTAYGARLALYRRGLRVPEDMSLIGFDDLPMSSYTTPPLTTIRQPVYEVGQTAAKRLLRLIRGEGAESVNLNVELVIRESTRRLG